MTPAAQPFMKHILQTAFVIFFAYFIVLVSYYFLMAVLGYFEEKKRAHEREGEAYSILAYSSFTLPISLIIPAHNEEEWIADCLKAVLNFSYPEFEVIVVDDGSIDKTFEILNNFLRLTAYDKVYEDRFGGGKIHGIFKSERDPRVTVIQKASGHKKAGAVNAGLNLARYKYVGVTDADTILEPDALMRVMAEVQKDPEHIIGIGSYFGLSNGFDVREGKIVQRSFSYNPIIACQNLEYIRSFIGLRIGWSRFNATPNIAGGFGLWRRDVVSELGGFATDYTCEDIEYTFRAHRYRIKHSDKGYKIVMLPYVVGWTEGPSNVKSLVIQRNRWQRVVNETLWQYRKMICNPKYGVFALFVLPYYLLYEVFGFLFEGASVLLALWGCWLGIFDMKVFAAFFLFMALVQGFTSLACLMAFLKGQRAFQTKYVLYLMALSFLEFFWYRWLILYAKISGTASYFRGVKDYTMYTREKRITKESPS